MYPQSKCFILITCTMSIVAGALLHGCSRATASPSADSGAAVLCDAIGCTSAQRDTIDRALMGLHRQTLGEYGAILKLEGVLAQEFLKDEPGEEILGRNLDEIAAHRKKIDQHVRRVLLQVHAEIDREQRARVVELMRTGGLRSVFKQPALADKNARR